MSNEHDDQEEQDDSFDDERLLKQIARIRATTHSLRHKLAKERAELERERSLYSIQSPSSCPVQEPYPHPTTHPTTTHPTTRPPPPQLTYFYYRAAVPDYQQLLLAPPSTPYLQPYPYPYPYPQTPLYNSAPNVYQYHLENVDRLCAEEYFKMQSNIKCLRRIRNEYCRDYRPASSGGNAADSENNNHNYVERKVRRRIRRRVYYNDDYSN